MIFFSSPPSYSYAEKEPSVNSVCFCFPFPRFFPPPPVAFSETVVLCCSTDCSCSAIRALPPPLQTDAAGAELPKIFCNEPLLPAAGAGRRCAPDGNSGNAAFESFGGGGGRFGSARAVEGPDVV